jgi:AraC family transcriptional regulator
MNMQIPGIDAGTPRHAGPFVVREIAYPPGLRQERHAHTYRGVTLVIAGSIRESAGRREEIGDALSVVVKPPGVEHADEIGPRGARTLQVAIDADAARALLDGDGRLECWRWLHADTPSAAMLALLRLVRAAGPSAGVLEDGVVDVLGTLARDDARSSAPPSWLKRVKEALDDGSQLSVRGLARDAGVHEVTLSRTFAQHYGSTITDYRRRLRVRRAARWIEAGSEHISRIAHASGYADHAHLCREFRRTAGVTPSAFRSLAAGNADSTDVAR